MDNFHNVQVAVKNCSGTPTFTPDVRCLDRIAGDRLTRYLGTHDHDPRPWLVARRQQAFQLRRSPARGPDDEPNSGLTLAPPARPRSFSAFPIAERVAGDPFLKEAPMSRPKTPARDWQAEIYQKHAGWIAGSHINMAVGHGWADVLSKLFDRIAEALADEPVPTKVAIIDVKEKYAELRAEFLAPVGPETQAAIDRAILLAEMRSECTCDECGREGRLRSTLGQSGWLAVKCDGHSSGYPRTIAKGQPRRRVTDRRGTFEAVYDRATDTVVEIKAND